ncbi:MAG: hypothetical protein OXG38_06345 [Chloroflexi bacterium]|nr:hypothetical protein [Chloroflexota bacterium]
MCPDAAAPDPRTADAERPVFAQLEALGVTYERLPCDPALADTEQFCAHYGIDPALSGNTIIVGSRREPRQFSACLVTATQRLDVNRTMRRLMGVRTLSFASAEDTAALTGMLIGGVTMFGLPDDLPKYIDPSLLTLPEIVIGGGSRSCKLRLAPAELRKLPSLQVVEGLALSRA